MPSSVYSLFVHKLIYLNSMPDHATMPWLIIADIHEVEAKLKDRIGNKQPIFQIQLKYAEDLLI